MEQGSPEQVIGEQRYGIFVRYEGKSRCNADRAKHRSTPPCRGSQEYGVLLEPNTAYHPDPYPDCLALGQFGAYRPGIEEYCQHPQEFMLPVLFTSLAPYAPPYMYQPMAAQLAPHATQTSFHAYPPGIVLVPTVGDAMCVWWIPLTRFCS